MATSRGVATHRLGTAASLYKRDENLSENAEETRFPLPADTVPSAFHAIQCQRGSEQLQENGGLIAPATNALSRLVQKKDDVK